MFMSSINRWRSGLVGTPGIGRFIVRLLICGRSRDALSATDTAQRGCNGRIFTYPSTHATSRAAGSFLGQDETKIDRAPISVIRLVLPRARYSRGWKTI